ncbi:hypothetical protein J3459_018689 [Metarhizium acridum]|uniref:uncharacterized protein n=1 Tax=Metarhizium acridum TaxID=92637 RepID=UPI001C6B836A|nr:hypothetical protein J3459_018689 [Metarhizium acridum]KAG8410135.1 hypothetical protein J3458_019202 [Metarhizium acridum]
MPRPKVLPSQRRRAAEACNFCRDAKKKCSGTAPCSHCLRRGIGSQCIITLRSRGSRNQAASDGPILPSDTQPHRIGLEAQSDVLDIVTSGPGCTPSAQLPVLNVNGKGRRKGPDASSFRPPSPSDSRPSFEGSESPERRRHQASDASSASGNPHSRMLLNLRGERVYIGGAASLSFLQLVRSIVADQIGPSQFSHNDKSDTMLEKESPSSMRHLRSSTPPELDVETKLLYSQCYRAVTEGFIDIFAPTEIEQYFMLPDDSSFSPQKRAALGMVISIGAQCKSAASARDIGQGYFRQAQAQAFQGMLEDPDIDVVRSFLLMAFYLLGECRRNAAFMYLGIATRAAVALGLHSQESYQNSNDLDDNKRIRIWVSLRIVDMLVNAILGRPAATAGLSSDVNTILEHVSQTEQTDEMACLIASHQIVSIINGIVDILYERKEISTSVVENLLNEIGSWSQSLPSCLRSPAKGRALSGSSYTKGAIGSVHVSCLYYFAVTLVTRPILISTLTAPPASGGLIQSQLASACLDAAVYLIQACMDARKVDILYGNMCIMKALVFAAGLVLGFEIFAMRSIEFDIEAAFAGARDILNFLATQSPQAGHYYEILTLLSNAISKQRQNAASTGRSRYVSKIFTLQEAKEPVSDRPRDDQGRLTPLVGGLVPPLAENAGNWLSDDRTPADPGQEVFLGWDSLDISQWDNFPFVP